MWQRIKKDDEQWHFIKNTQADLNGYVCETACGEKIVLDIAAARTDPYLVPGCKYCVPIWHLVCTSVDEARAQLKNVFDMRVLTRAALLIDSVTLLRAIDARIRKLEKLAVKEEKIRLTQQAYEKGLKERGG